MNNDRKKLKEVLETLYQYLRDLDIKSSGGPETIISTRMEEIISDLESYLSHGLWDCSDPDPWIQDDWDSRTD